MIDFEFDNEVDPDDGMDFGELTHQTVNIKQKEWMKSTKMAIVSSLDMLDEVIDKCIAAKHYGYDTETNSLDVRVFNKQTVAKLAGHCLAPSKDEGYYIPVRHRKGVSNNLPIVEVNKRLRRLANSKAVAVFHNCGYDGEILRYGEDEPIGEWDNHKDFEDTLLLSYLNNPRRKTHGLKDASREHLGRVMIELNELYPKDYPKNKLDFMDLDPSENGPIWYACSDAMCTVGLYHILKERVLVSTVEGVPSQATVYIIEKMCMSSVRWMVNHCRIPIDQEKVRELILVSQDGLVKAMRELYDEIEKVLGRDIKLEYVRNLFANYEKDRVNIRINKDYLDLVRKRSLSKDPREKDGKTIIKFTKNGKSFPLVYDVLSPAQLGPMFEELGIPDLPTTETGKISTSTESIDAIMEANGDKFEYMKAVTRFRENYKALSSFLFNLENDVDPTDGTLLIKFKQCGTDTGRFTTPGDKRHPAGTSTVLQSLPSKDKKGKVEGLRRIRETVKARPGFVIVAIDYSGVELRLVTNQSLEEKWVQAFYECSTCKQKYDNTPEPDTGLPPRTPAYCYNCGDDRIGDLHTISGIAFFGADAPNKPNWKELRGDAKATNFALLFGGTGNTVKNRIGCEKNEGWRIFQTFNSTYLGLKRWQEGQKKFAQRNGFVVTPFGRRYPTPDINHTERWIREKTERNAINSPIQGASADVTKLGMGLCYIEVKKRGWLDKVRMIITIHDELVFEVAEDGFQEIIEVLENAMSSNKVLAGVKWPVRLTTDLEFGRDWTVPYDRKDWVFQRRNDLTKWPEWAIGLFDERSIDPVIKSKMDKKGVAPYKFGDPVDPDDAHVTTSVPVSKVETSNSAKVETSNNVKVETSNNVKVETSNNVKVTATSTEDEIENIPSGDIFEYKLTRPLGFGCIEALCQLIHKSMNRGGTKKLRVTVPGMGVLIDVDEGIVVNANRFLTLAEETIDRLP